MSPLVAGRAAVDRKRLAEMVCERVGDLSGVAAACGATVAVAKTRGLRYPRVRLGVSVVAEYGTSLPELAAEVRESATRAVESSTDCRVTAVDVTVVDLYVPGEPLAGRGPAGGFPPGARLDF